MKLELIYEDGDIFAVNKPAGLLSVPGRGADKFASVQSYCQEICVGAMAIHRLDMATSGVLLVAKHKEAERFYKMQFEQRTVEKVYEALVRGHLTPPAGLMDFPLIVDWERRPMQKVCYETGRPALTRYQLLGHEGDDSRVALYPHTGRSHQLRVHLAHLGFPILGDEFYNPTDARPRLMLHARRLEVRRPDGEQLILISPTPF